MFIRATRRFVWVPFSRYLTNRFLRGVADDNQPEQPEAQTYDAAFFDVGSAPVS